LALPELYPAEGTADVCIRFGKGEQRPRDLDADGNAFWCDGKGRSACHYRQGTGWVTVTGGSTIVVEPEDSPDPALLRLAILGPGMALVLMQRGLFAFHASAVAISGSGVAFLGGHAAGKSSMAATLHTRGHALVTDDVSVLDDIDGDIHVVPSFPQVKLWANAAEDLGLEAGTMPTSRCQQVRHVQLVRGPVRRRLHPGSGPGRALPALYRHHFPHPGDEAAETGGGVLR
jgi:hypothetical protein